MIAHRRFLGWGVFLVGLGIVPLTVALGVIDAQSAASILRLWPFILIGIGFTLILHWSRYAELSRILTAGLFGLVVGVFFVGGLASPAFICGGGQPVVAPVTQTGTFSGPSAGVTIELTCGQIDLARTADQGWTVAMASDGSAPLVRADADRLELRSANNQFVGPFPGGSDEHWRVTLPASTEVNAGVTLNAARGRLVFGNGALGHVSTTSNGSDSVIDLRGATGDSSVSSTLNASSVKLLLPDAATQVSLTLNVSSLTVCVPPTVGLRVSYSQVLGSDNFAAVGLSGGGEAWSTSGFDVVTDLHITNNLSSLTIDRSGVCQ